MNKGNCEVIFEKTLDNNEVCCLLLTIEDITKEVAKNIKEVFFLSDPKESLAYDYEGNTFTLTDIKEVNFIPYENKIKLL